jgi:chromosome segregation ATPase
MNPLVAQRIKQITKGIEELKAELLEAQRQIADLSEARNELQRKCWAQAKEIAVFKERVEELAPLKEQNALLLKQITDFEERLKRVLAQTENLEMEFRS